MQRQFTYRKHDEKGKLIVVYAETLLEANELAKEQGASFERCRTLGLFGGECGSSMWYVVDPNGVAMTFAGILVGRFVMSGRSYRLVDMTAMELDGDMADWSDDQVSEWLELHQDEDHYVVRVLARFDGEFEMNQFWKGGLYIDD